MFFVVIYNLNIKNDKGVVGMKDLHFNIHYLDESVPPLETFDGNWVDLRAIEVKVIRANGEIETHKSSEFETVNYEKDDVLFVNFGFAMDMPLKLFTYAVAPSIAKLSRLKLESIPILNV